MRVHANRCGTCFYIHFSDRLLASVSRRSDRGDDAHALTMSFKWKVVLYVNSKCDLLVHAKRAYLFLKIRDRFDFSTTLIVKPAHLGTNRQAGRLAWLNIIF